MFLYKLKKLFYLNISCINNDNNMNNTNGFIYIRNHIYYINDNICKLGKTKNIPERDNNYATSEYRRGKFELVIEILNNQIYDDTYIEKLLQKYFKKYHSKINGGTEFYQNKIIDEIVPFLSKTIIKFRVLTEEEINNLTHIKRIKLLQVLLKKFFHNRETKENRLRNKLQEIYLIEILYNLITYNKVFLKAPTGFGKTHLYYKTILQMKFNRILFLTPRLELNHQIVEDKYSSYTKNDNYEVIHFSDLNYLSKEDKINKYSKIILLSGNLKYE